MVDDPNLDDIEDRSGFPWMTLIIMISVFIAAGSWLYYGRNHPGGDPAAALEKELVADKTVLDTERQKVFDITDDLDLLKQDIASGQAGDKAAAVEKYNQMAKAQNEQREKVKRLADDYNAKVAKLQELR